VLKHRPINDDFNLLYTNSDPKRREPTEYLQQCWRFLEEELALAKPNLVIALDKEALRALTGKVSITKWRGSLLRSKTGLNILPSLHPKHVLRVWNEKPILELDLRRAARKCSVASWTPTTYHTVTRPTFTVTMQWLALADAPGSTLSFDIETFHNLGRIRCLGLSTSADPRPNAICIPFIYNINETHVGTTQIQLSLGLEGETKPRAEYANYWTEEQEEALLLRLDKILSNPAIKKVAQNAQFDMTILASDLGLKVRGLYLDTMVAQHCCYAELPKGLDFLASIYTDIPYWSDYNVDVDQETWIYNCYDVIATLQIAKHLETVELKELNQYDFYFEHVHPTILALMDVQDRGLLVDVALQQQQKAATTLIVNTLREKLAAIAGKPEFNPNSPKQLQWLLYEKLALPMKTNKKGKPTADKHSIESLAQSPRCTEHRGLLLELLDYSKQETLLSGFLSKPTAPNGRIYTSLNIAGTVTRRLASSAPLHKVGTNLQNMPRGEFRRLFIATPGWWMIKADLSQAEFRIVCWLAKIQRIIDKYVQSNDFDVHRWVAGLIYGKPEADVTKAERSLAKNGVYGGNYAMRYDKAA
jgi:DNA polymerase I-like protein with 3'-5' exonuclease and polymerase domains